MKTLKTDAETLKQKLETTKIGKEIKSSVFNLIYWICDFIILHKKLVDIR